MKLSRRVMWNVYSGAIAAGTAFLAHKIVDGAWRAVTGAADTPDPNDPDTPATQAILWALASGVGIGVAQLVVNRYAAERWQRFTGEDIPSARPVFIAL